MWSCSSWRDVGEKQIFKTILCLAIFSQYPKLICIGLDSKSAFFNVKLRYSVVAANTHGANIPEHSFVTPNL